MSSTRMSALASRTTTKFSWLARNSSSVPQDHGCPKVHLHIHSSIDIDSMEPTRREIAGFFFQSVVSSVLFSDSNVDFSWWKSWRMCPRVLVPKWRWCCHCRCRKSIQGFRHPRFGVSSLQETSLIKSEWGTVAWGGGPQVFAMPTTKFKGRPGSLASPRNSLIVCLVNFLAPWKTVGYIIYIIHLIYSPRS